MFRVGHISQGFTAQLSLENFDTDHVTDANMKILRWVVFPPSVPKLFEYDTLQFKNHITPWYKVYFFHSVSSPAQKFLPKTRSNQMLVSSMAPRANTAA